MENIEKIPVIKPWQDSVFDFLSDTWVFLVDYQVPILIFAITIASIILFKKTFGKRKRRLVKIWNYTLFFLTKRQMMIPLVYSLSKKDGVLDHEVLSNLLKIRNECRNVSLRTKPTERLKLEQKVSKILFYYFSSLEKENQIKSGSKFEKIVKDLEFIDAKLIQLQQVYNLETKKWNQLVGNPLLGWVFAIFNFSTFEKFSIPE